MTCRSSGTVRRQSSAVVCSFLVALSAASVGLAQSNWPPKEFELIELPQQEPLGGSNNNLLDPVVAFSISPNGVWVGGSALSEDDRRPIRYSVNTPGGDVWTLDIILMIGNFDADVEAFEIAPNGATSGYGIRTAGPTDRMKVRVTDPAGGSGYSLRGPGGTDIEGQGWHIAEYALASDEGCDAGSGRVVGYWLDGTTSRAAYWGPYDIGDDDPPIQSAHSLPVGTSNADSAALSQSAWTQVVGYQSDQACLWTYTPGSSCGTGTWAYTMLPLSSGYTSSRAIDITNTDTNSGAGTDAIIVGYETDSQGVDRAVKWTFDVMQSDWIVTTIAPTSTTSTRAVAVDLDGHIIYHDTYLDGQDEVTVSYAYHGSTGSSYEFTNTNVPALASDESILVMDVSDSYDRLVAVVTDPDATPTDQTQRIVILEVDCVGDLNDDGTIDFDDLVLLLGDWGNSTPAYDLDGSGEVDFDDLLIVLANWGCGMEFPGELPPDIVDCLNASSNPARQLDCIEGLIQTTGSGSGGGS